MKNKSEKIALLALLTIGSMEVKNGNYCSVDEFKARMAKKYCK